MSLPGVGSGAIRIDIGLRVDPVICEAVRIHQAIVELKAVGGYPVSPI